MMVLMMAHKICINRGIWIIIPLLSQLPLLNWSTVSQMARWMTCSLQPFQQFFSLIKMTRRVIMKDLRHPNLLQLKRAVPPAGFQLGQQAH